MVSKGDTLYNIAKRNSTTVEAIKTLNGLVSNLIKVGQTLQLK
nr:LysM peptidoglycan-binding domain-containing protein [Psychroserpens sp. Hel_I_66]